MLLATMRLLLRLRPFKLVAQRLGRIVSPAEARAATPPASAEQISLAADISWAVTRAARDAPFRAVCLPQAMTARVMLARRGVPSVLHYGATTQGEAAIEAHAWLSAAGVEVTGYPVPARFTEIACFV